MQNLERLFKKGDVFDQFTELMSEYLDHEIDSDLFGYQFSELYLSCEPIDYSRFKSRDVAGLMDDVNVYALNIDEWSSMGIEEEDFYRLVQRTYLIIMDNLI
jgi:hypothetical protein